VPDDLYLVLAWPILPRHQVAVRVAVKSRDARTMTSKRGGQGEVVREAYDVDDAFIGFGTSSPASRAAAPDPAPALMAY